MENPGAGSHPGLVPPPKHTLFSLWDSKHEFVPDEKTMRPVLPGARKPPHVEDVFFQLVRSGHAYTVYDPIQRRLVFVTRGEECQAFPLERN